MDHYNTQSSSASITASITAFWLQTCSYLQTTIKDGALVLGGLWRLMGNGMINRWNGDQKRITIGYFGFVLCMRIFIRSATGQAMPWYIIMAIEDGLSVMSFVVGLLYLHNSDGISRALFKRAPASSQGELSGSPVPTRPEDMKLFYYAM